jgi:hypothetical protein
MTKSAVTLFAALALTLAAISGAQAATLAPIVHAPSAGSLTAPPSDCMRVPPFPIKCVTAL